jgi:hypothetical protein
MNPSREVSDGCCRAEKPVRVIYGDADATVNFRLDRAT